MRGVLYQRVSADRAEGRSVREQEADNRAVCQREGWPIVGVYTDNDRSASRYARKDRPDWQRLLADLPTLAPDVIVLWELSRATRDRLVWAVLIEECADRHIHLCIGGRVYDPTDADDAFALDLMISLGVRESSVTRKRVIRSVRANANAGRPHGRMLYGYRREYDPTSGQLLAQVPDEHAPVIKEIHARLLAGQSCYGIAQDLNARGVKSPVGKPWLSTQIRRVGLNPAYAGKRVHQGKVIGDAVWPALVDELTHHRLVGLLTDPARRTNGDNRAVRHLLTGLAVCGVCGARCKRIKNRSTPSYACGTRFCVSRTMAGVDAYVTAAVIGWLARPGAAAAFTPDTTGDLEILDELAQRRARLTGFYDTAAQGDLTPAGLARIEARLLPEIAGLEQRLRRSRTSPLLTAMTTDPAGAWERLTVPQRREVVDCLAVVVIHKSVRGSRPFNPATVEIRWR